MHFILFSGVSTRPLTQTCHMFTRKLVVVGCDPEVSLCEISTIFGSPSHHAYVVRAFAVSSGLIIEY